MKKSFIEKVSDGLTATGNAIKAAGNAVASWCRKHWALIAAVILASIAFAAVMVALVFFWPATITALAAFSVTLPIIGSIAPLAFLGTLALPAAAAVVAAGAFVATLVVSGLINGFAAIYNAIDNHFNPKTGGPGPHGSSTTKPGSSYSHMHGKGLSANPYADVNDEDFVEDEDALLSGSEEQQLGGQEHGVYEDQGTYQNNGQYADPDYQPVRLNS